MPITIDFTPDFNTQGCFFAPGASFEQSQWLGKQGWYFYGRKSKRDLANKLQAAGVPINSRWLPASKAAVAAQVVGVEGVELTERAAAKLTHRAEAAKASRATDAEVDVPTPEGLSFRPYQRGGIAYALSAFERGQKGIIIGDEMGLGKTMQAIGCMVALDLQRVLVVAPASTLTNWQREIEKWWPSAKGEVQVIAGREPVDPSARVVVLNYEKVTGKHGKPTKEAILAEEWDLAVFDEAQRIKNPKSQRTAVFVGKENRGKVTQRGVSHNSKRVLILTGTPLQNRPKEMIPALQAIEAFGEAGMVKHPGVFLRRYCNAGINSWTGRPDYSGATNLTEMQANLRAGWMVRRLKKDVAKELPPKIRQIVPVNGKSAEKARQVEQEILGDEVYAELQKAAEKAKQADPASLDEAWNLIAKKVPFEEISAVRAELAELKREHVLKHVDDVLEGDDERKVLLFAHHRTVIDAAAEHYGERCIRIDGSTPQAERADLVDRFQNDPAVRVAVLSTHAAGEGITLTAADTCVFAEADWNPSWLQQAEDRAHRIGQTADSVHYAYLVFDETLDAHVLQAAVRKMDIADAALDTGAEGPQEAAPADPRPKAEPAPRADGKRRVTVQVKREPRTFLMDDDRKSAVEEALARLASLNADRACEKNDVGFNRNHTESDFVQDCVRYSQSGQLTDKQAAAMIGNVLVTYKNTQIADLAPRLWPEQHEEEGS